MLHRIFALLVKELAALLSDRKVRSVLVVPPLVQVALFAYAATYDVTNVPLAIWNDDAGAQSAALVRAFAGSPAFLPVEGIQSPGQAAIAIDTMRATAVLHIPERFSADLLARRTPHVQLLLDARRSNTALLIEAYSATIVADFAQTMNTTSNIPISLTVRDWFNPTLESQWFILPGLVAVLSIIMSMLISALSLARERELGTFDQLLVTPLRPLEILAGKAVPGVIIGLIDANIVIAAALLWFQIPFRGSMIVLQAILILYMIAGVGIGLVISSITHTQQQAMLGVFVIAAPIVVLSGFLAPVENMPPVIEVLGRIDPIRWMLIIVRGLFLENTPLPVVLQSTWPLALIATATFAMAGVAVRRAVT